MRKTLFHFSFLLLLSYMPLNKGSSKQVKTELLFFSKSENSTHYTLIDKLDKSYKNVQKWYSNLTWFKYQSLSYKRSYSKITWVANWGKQLLWTYNNCLVIVPSNSNLFRCSIADKTSIMHPGERNLRSQVVEAVFLKKNRNLDKQWIQCLQIHWNVQKMSHYKRHL